jgi:hypothetical protein
MLRENRPQSVFGAAGLPYRHLRLSAAHHGQSRTLPSIQVTD